MISVCVHTSPSGMKLRWLLNALHRGHFGQDVLQQTRGVQQFESAARAAFGQNSVQLFPNTLRRNARDALVHFSDRRQRARLDFKTKARGEADGAQHAQMVLFETLRGIANGADHAVLQILQAAYVVHHVPGGIVHMRRIEQQSIDGEVAPQHILLRVAFERHAFRMPPILVRMIAAEGCDFDAVYQDHAELRAHQLRLRKKL